MGLENEVQIFVTAEIDRLVAAMGEASSVTDKNLGEMRIAFDKLSANVELAMEKIAAETRKGTAEAGTSLERLREKMALTAEGARVSAFGVGSAMGALGAVFGGVLVFEFFDKFKEGVLQMNHLSEATGIEVQKLVELKDSMQVAGVSTERLPQQLSKLSVSIQAASLGSKGASHEFHQLGVETDGWKNKLPAADEVLLQMADHLKTSKNPTNDLAAATKLLGRNSFELVAFLHQGSAAIKQQMREHQDHAKAIADSVEAAKTLQREEAQLSQSLTTIAAPAFRVLVVVVQSVEAAFYYAAAAINTIVIAIKQVVEIAYDSLKMIGAAQAGFITGGVKGAVAAMKAGGAEMKDDTARNADLIKGIWKDTQDKVDGIFKEIPEEAKKGNAEIVADADNSAKQRLKFEKSFAKQMKELGKEIAAADKDNREFMLKQLIEEGKEEEKAGKEKLAQAKKDLKELQASIIEEYQLKKDLRLTDLDGDMQAAQNEYALGKISKEKLLTLERAFHQQQLAEEMKVLEAKLAIFKNDPYANPMEVARLENQILILKRKMRQTDSADLTKQLDEQKKKYNAFFSHIGGAFSQSINGMIFNNQKLSKSLSNMLQNMLGEFINAMVQRGLHWLEELTLEAVLHSQFLVKLLGLEQLAAAQKVAAHAVATKAQILGDAQLAGAATYAVVASWWPDGPVIAPGMAAGAITAVSAMAAVPSAMGGWEVDRDSLAMVHKDEKILSPKFSQGLDDLIQTSKAGGGGDRPITVEQHYHAMDSRGMGGMLRNNSRELVRTLKWALRNGARIKQ